MLKQISMCIASLLCCCAAGASNIERIAHAGGIYQGATYTNSINALEENLQHGFTFFEIDLNWTSDGELVCIHDWKNSFKRIFKKEASEIPTLESFRRLVREHTPMQICTLDELLSWLDRHPTTFLVTDVKDRNVTALSMIASRFPDYRTRVIPQIYHPREYQPVRRMGYEKIIWTLYRFSGGPAAVLSETQAMDLFAVTMPRERADTGLALELDKLDIATYVHTINRKEELAHFQRLGIDNIYTDSLKPE